MPGRYIVALVFVVLASSACRASLERHRAEPIPVQTSSVGGGLLVPTEAPSRAPASTPPLFVARLDDQNDLHPQGIPVKVTGPVNRTVLSDARGEVRLSGPPGDYRLEVVRGCHERVLVTGGGSANVHTVAGVAATGTLRVIWQHRIAPAPPAFANVSGDWPMGKEIEVTYTATDRCNENPVPGGEYQSFVFKTSPNIKVVGTPQLQADDRGRGRVRLACTSPGVIDLVVTDQEDPSDHTDFSASLIDFNGPPRCAKA